jgi:hypothetical protein
MKKETIVDNLPDGTNTREQILKAAQLVEPSFKETQLRYLIETLYDSNLLVRAGRNQYKKVDKNNKKSIFSGVYSNVAEKVIKHMQQQFPLLSYRVWELSWLNEFFNHQLSHNYIFLEVEKDGVDFVFSSLIDKIPGKVLLEPSIKEITQYGTDDGIIIDRLVTESPKSDGESYKVPLEKLIVDMFANKYLKLFKGDYPIAIETMFNKYYLNQSAMLSYARRRNKEDELVKFIQDNTKIN